MFILFEGEFLFIEGVFVKRRQQQPLWNRAKKIFVNAGKAKQKLRSKVKQEFEEEFKVTSMNLSITTHLKSLL